MDGDATVSSIAASTVEAAFSEKASDGASLTWWIVSLMARFIERLVLAGFVASAVGSLFHVDYFTLGMCLTYTPRVLWLLVALLLSLVYLRQQKLRHLGLIVVLTMVLCYDATWGGGMHLRGTAETLTLLSFNTHYACGDEVANLCDQFEVDILVAQENRPGAGNRQAFMATLPGYQFFAADQKDETTCRERSHFTNITGVRRDLISQTSSEKILGGLTGFRTFGVELDLHSGPMRIVNVHTIKPVQLSLNPRLIAARLRELMRRHQTEHELLTQWLGCNADSAMPTLIAGDFNAPGNGHNLRFANYKNAQRQCGQGLHLTFPAKFPIVGIDHVLGNEHIQFQSCEILDTGISDHRAMLVKFSIAKTESQTTEYANH